VASNASLHSHGELTHKHNSQIEMDEQLSLNKFQNICLKKEKEKEKILK
jgi:hypothetical protein